MILRHKKQNSERQRNKRKRENQILTAIAHGDVYMIVATQCGKIGVVSFL